MLTPNIKPFEHWAASCLLLIIERGHFINFSAFCSVRNDDLWDWFTSAACFEAKIGFAQQCTLPRGPLGEEDILGYPSQQYARKATKIVNCKMNTSLVIMMREWFILCEDQLIGNSACLCVHIFSSFELYLPSWQSCIFCKYQKWPCKHAGLHNYTFRRCLWRCTGENFSLEVHWREM